jgi:hypothetical protein
MHNDAETTRIDLAQFKVVALRQKIPVHAIESGALDTASDPGRRLCLELVKRVDSAMSVSAIPSIATARSRRNN